ADRHHWVVDGPAHVPVEWDSEITERIEGEMMAWRSTAGSRVDNAGRVRFKPEGYGTRVEVTLCYMPVGGVIGHAVARALGSDPRSRMDDDLMRFKTLIEGGGVPHDAAVRRGGAGDWSGSVVRH
ncbi:MAG TPA: SRPBCC family protein, partial [Gemmatimonadales bacterium]|nr:SRPBCC family protein [Gemmatimonadales bacterium]